MKETKIQWHPGFIAAMNLELTQNKNDLLFEKEHNLNTKPLEIDLLIIKKETFTDISNEIGKIFRGHNILEYKSPEDHMDIDVFYKATAYACLYKSYGRTLDEIKEDEITVSLVRENKPQNLFRYFGEHGYKLSNPYRGIYYVESRVLFPTQIIVTRELDMQKHLWLKALSEKLRKSDMKAILEKASQLIGKEEREYADSILEVTVRANMEIIEELRGDENMCQALMEIMEPEIRLIKEEGLRTGREEGLRTGREEGRKEGQKEGRKEGRKEGILGTVKVLRNLGQSSPEIKSVLMETYGLSETEADDYLLI
ncbi:MAG: hypothetical protein NC307_03445 [Roseburia sp.]|nr:hypothetical protein [Roseburia sp.]